MPRTKKVEVKKEKPKAEEVVSTGFAEVLPSQCLRCGGRAHEPNNECDAMK